MLVKKIIIKELSKKNNITLFFGGQGPLECVVCEKSHNEWKGWIFCTWPGGPLVSVHFLDLKIFPAWKGFCPFQTDKKLHQAWKVSNCKSMRLHILFRAFVVFWFASKFPFFSAGESIYPRVHERLEGPKWCAERKRWTPSQCWRNFLKGCVSQVSDISHNHGSVKNDPNTLKGNSSEVEVSNLSLHNAW